jgi:two-component system, OmpR family, osmolarity sensor histidine kinase EnvZ
MSLLPRSLLGRNALLIVALIVIGQLGGALLVRQMVIRPRVEQAADSVARTVQAMREGLTALPVAERQRFVDGFNQRSALAAGEGHDTRDTVLLSPMERRFVRAVSGRLADSGTEAVWRFDGGRGLAMRMAIDGTVYWISLPGALPAREFTGAWLAVTAVSALLAVIGALWFQRRLNRPLARVVQAAGVLASGQVPPPLPEGGPTEIATVSRSFNHLVASLQQTERERALMLAGVSHDLRTPLAKLRLGVEIMASASEPAVSASMVRSIEEMDAIVGQFLDFARSEADEPPVPTSLDAMARDVAASNADHGRDVGLELGDVPAMPLRAAAMRRAMVNLVENAWRHGRAPVRIATGIGPQGLWFEVSDRGDGIHTADAERLKQPFRRSTGDARGGPAGAGLGLAIVQRVAQAHGGRLDLLPAEGGGLRARVSIPPPDRSASSAS